MLKYLGMKSHECATYSQMAHPKGKNIIGAGWMFTVLVFQLFYKFEFFLKIKSMGGGRKE